MGKLYTSIAEVQNDPEVQESWKRRRAEAKGRAYRRRLATTPRWEVTDPIGIDADGNEVIRVEYYRTAMHIDTDGTMRLEPILGSDMDFEHLNRPWRAGVRAIPEFADGVHDLMLEQYERRKRGHRS